MQSEMGQKTEFNIEQEMYKINVTNCRSRVGLSPFYTKKLKNDLLKKKIQNFTVF